jgi:hypothetical protein
MKPTMLEQLRSQIGRVRNYGRFWERYLEHFASDAEFQQMSRPAEDESLTRALCSAAAVRLQRPDVKIIGLQFREIPGEGLVHGACFLNGRFCTFLFSRPQRLGLMALASLVDDRVIYSRFSMGPRAAAAAA